MLSQDFKELLSAFNEHHVKYLIVGGYAGAVHAQPRATKDLDLFIEPSVENARAVFSALEKFGAPLAGVGEIHRHPTPFYAILSILPHAILPLAAVQTGGG